MKVKPSIYICIPVYNRLEYTKKCIKSIYNQDYKNVKIIIFDAGSNDGTYQFLTEFYPEIITIKGSADFWWTASINVCVQKALSLASNQDFIYTLNNDTILLSNTLTQIVESAVYNPNAIIGSVNLFFNNPRKIEPSAFIKTKWGQIKRLHNQGDVLPKKKILQEVYSLSGKGCLIPVFAFKKNGLYNEKQLPHYHADTEWVIRARKKGYKIFINYHSALLSHYEQSGKGTWTSKPNIKEFIKSFSDIKSAHHLRYLYIYNKIISENFVNIRFILRLFYITGGFIKRFIKYHFTK